MFTPEQKEDLRIFAEITDSPLWTTDGWECVGQSTRDHYRRKVRLEFPFGGTHRKLGTCPCVQACRWENGNDNGQGEIQGPRRRR